MYIYMRIVMTNDPFRLFREGDEKWPDPDEEALKIWIECRDIACKTVPMGTQWTEVHTQAHICTHTHKHAHIHTHIRAHTLTHTHTHTRTHTHTYTHTHAHTHT